MSRSKRRQFVIIGRELRPGENAALGSQTELRNVLASYNTGPEGVAPEGAVLERFYGPGYVLEMALSVQTVQQMIAHVQEEGVAWPVLSKLCTAMRWRLMDIESGRIMDFAASL
jgi:hypothetical protein